MTPCEAVLGVGPVNRTAIKCGKDSVVEVESTRYLTKTVLCQDHYDYWLYTACRGKLPPEWKVTSLTIEVKKEIKHKCNCDFYTVLLRSGCKCGGS